MKKIIAIAFSVFIVSGYVKVSDEEVFADVSHEDVPAVEGSVTTRQIMPPEEINAQLIQYFNTLKDMISADISKDGVNNFDIDPYFSSFLKMSVEKAFEIELTNGFLRPILHTENGWDDSFKENLKAVLKRHSISEEDANSFITSMDSYYDQFLALVPKDHISEPVKGATQAIRLDDSSSDFGDAAEAASLNGMIAFIGAVLSDPVGNFDFIIATIRSYLPRIAEVLGMSPAEEQLEESALSKIHVLSALKEWWANFKRTYITKADLEDMSGATISDPIDDGNNALPDA